MIKKIVSGGQTGVDRGALDAAMEMHIDHGGFSPLGHMGEDGRIPDKYKLTEASRPGYPQRTELNVLNSDATLILGNGKPSRGTDLTKRLAARHGKPLIVADITRDAPQAVANSIEAVIDAPGIVLNVAGPRESNDPGIQERSREFLRKVLEFLSL